MEVFDAMDGVLGYKPATQPPVVVESGDVSVHVEEEEEEEDVVEEELSVVCRRGGECSSSGQEREEVSRSRSETPVAQEKGVEKGVVTQRRGKKRKWESDKFEVMEWFVEKIVNMQEESDRKYMKLEENILEMEKQRQRGNRGFQFQMMSMLYQQQGPRPSLMHTPSTSTPAGFAPPAYPYPSMYSFTYPIDNEDE